MLVGMCIGKSLSFLEEIDKEKAKDEYVSVVDGVVAESTSDIKTYGFYSVSGDQLSDDIAALEALFEILDDTEIVEINGLEYQKDDLETYIEVDKDLLSYFGDGEVVLIGTDEGTQMVTEDELAGIEQEILESNN